MSRTPKPTKIVARDSTTGEVLLVLDIGTVEGQTYGAANAADQPVVNNPSTRAVRVDVISGAQMLGDSGTLILAAAGGASVAPTITAHPQSQTIQQGQTATLQVAAVGTDPLSYQWRRDGIAINGATSTSYGATIAGAYTAVVSNAAGSVISNAATLTVNGASVPVASFVRTPSGGTGATVVSCIGSATNAPTGWQWTLLRPAGTPLTFDTAQNPTFNIPATPVGTWTIRLIATNAAGSSAPVEQSVTILAPPVPSFDVNPSSGPAPLTVTLDNTSTNVIAGDTYSWTYGDGNSSTAAEPGQHAYTTTGVRTISLSITRSGVTYGPATQQISVGATTQNVTVTIGAQGRTITSALLDSAKLGAGDQFGSSTNIVMDGARRMLVRSTNINADIAAAVAAAVASVSGTSGAATAVRLHLKRTAGSASLGTVSEVTSTWTEAAPAFPSIGSALGAFTFGDQFAYYGSANLTGWLANANRVHGLAIEVNAGQPNVIALTKEWDAEDAPYLAVDVAVTVSGGGGPAAPNITDMTFAPASGWTTSTAITMTAVNSGGTISTYAWVFKLGGVPIPGGTSSAAVPTYTFSTPGVASAEVTVTGPGGSDVYEETIGTISAPGGNMFAALPMGSLGAEFTLPPWDPVPYVDLVRNTQGFHAFAANGSGAPVAVDANGDPTAGSWSMKLMENAGRGTAPVIPLGAWQVRATPRTPGTPGTWSLGIAAGGTLTDFAYNGGTNTVTANLNITDPQAVLVIRATEPCTGLRIIRPGYSIDSEQILHNEALAYTKQYATLRQFNRAGLNTGASASAKTWAQWPAANIRHGVPGWGELCKTFREVHEASGSKCKFFSVNAPPYWGDADYLAWAQFLKANLLDLVPTAGLLVGGPNELWNTIYPTFHYLLAQVNGQSVAATGDTVVQMSRADRIRVAGAGRGNAWRAVTSGSHSAGATSILIAAGGAGEGNLLAGDPIRFAGHGSNYTIVNGLANVATGGTITISPGLTQTVTAGSMIEVDMFTCFGRWWGLREARMWKTFRDVFGADWGARVFGMCHTHFMNPFWHVDLYLPFLQESTQLAEFGAINTYIHGIGGAPYPGLDIQSYFDAGSAQNIVDRLAATTAFHPGDTTVPVINTQLGIWTGIRNTYGIAHQYNYEIGCEHLGYVPNVQAITGESGQFYVNPFTIAGIRSANFQTQVGDALFAAVRANNVRVLEVLNPMPSSYVSKQESIDRGNPNLAANSHWGSVDAQIAATYAAVWSINTGQKAQALRDHMLAIGQLP